jgi:hypothetical protein
VRGKLSFTLGKKEGMTFKKMRNYKKYRVYTLYHTEGFNFDKPSFSLEGNSIISSTSSKDNNWNITLRAALRA